MRPEQKEPFLLFITQEALDDIIYDGDEDTFVVIN